MSSPCLPALVRMKSGWNEPQQVRYDIYMGRSRGRVTYCHHRGGRLPSFRAGGRDSVLGPPAEVSACN